jgi:small multidrug resistance family-3 protein
MTARLVVASLALFVLAGLCEIGGGYLMWSWWRNGASWLVGLAGVLVLALYGIVPTYQATHFGRVYAAYGGVFVVLALAWGWIVDGARPDRFDAAGGLICLAGVAVVMYWPR